MYSAFSPSGTGGRGLAFGLAGVVAPDSELDDYGRRSQYYTDYM